MKSIAKNQVTIDTTSYRWSQGREPKGRGTWAFSEERNSDDVLWFTGTYAEARAQAIAYAASKGITELYVQP